MQNLSIELIAGGLVGFFLFWKAVGQIAKGFQDASKTAKNIEPIATAVSISWDRDQIERAIQGIEGIKLALVEVAHIQKGLADQRTLNMDEKLDMLLEMIDKNEKSERGSHPRPRQPKP